MDWLQNFTPSSNLDQASVTAYVLLDVLLIIALARLSGNLMVRMGQARVVGEMLAGIMLGPTLLGEELSYVITPLQARPILNLIATLGLILFMFLAGVEFDVTMIKGQGKRAVSLALLSVAIPALVGFPVAFAIHNGAYAGPLGEAFLPFALMVGAALSVTAFPVMAHILLERGALNSPIGSLSVATAGLMSVMMFSYIAFAAAVATASGLANLLIRLGLIIAFALTSWFVVRPLLARLLMGMMDGETISGNAMALLFAGMVLAALIAQLLGIHALLGGFFWGLILPSARSFRQSVANKVRDIALILFLPVFFAMAGFSTDLKQLTFETLPAIALVLAAAVGSKFAAALPGRVLGLNWREVSILGALLNTRGLLVLVVGLIGLQLQIITSLFFTIIVLVALATNLMTMPLLNLFSGRPDERSIASSAVQDL